MNITNNPVSRDSYDKLVYKLIELLASKTLESVDDLIIKRKDLVSLSEKLDLITEKLQKFEILQI